MVSRTNESCVFFDENLATKFIARFPVRWRQFCGLYPGAITHLRKDISRTNSKIVAEGANYHVPLVYSDTISKLLLLCLVHRGSCAELGFMDPFRTIETKNVHFVHSVCSYYHVLRTNIDITRKVTLGFSLGCNKFLLLPPSVVPMAPKNISCASFPIISVGTENYCISVYCYTRTNFVPNRPLGRSEHLTFFPNGALPFENVADASVAIAYLIRS
mmetsp:Transcript_1789/g.3540  ORF Transcript_1789/g.3540 Transcript_1789/m.3540 type:complete len:216 (+) Transcript_1789:659-1306(+)